MASLSSGVPVFMVYPCSPFRMASTAPSHIKVGVGKSGSPALNEIMDFPSRWSSLARPVIFKVADGCNSNARDEIIGELR